MSKIESSCTQSVPLSEQLQRLITFKFLRGQPLRSIPIVSEHHGVSISRDAAVSQEGREHTGSTSIDTAFSTNGPVFLAAVFMAAALAAVVLSWKWPLILDGPLIQYIAFLIDHGRVPYKDIIDINGIGSYFSSLLELHLFGQSDLGWRIYDLLFLSIGCTGIALIAKPFGKAAATVSSCLFVLMHIREGIIELGQRDFQVAALELLASGLLLYGFRTQRRTAFFASGLAAALGAAIKPSAAGFVAAILVLGFMMAWLGKERRFLGPLCLAAGSLTICVTILLYLAYNGALWPFIDLYRRFLPVYSKMWHKPDYYLQSVLVGQASPLILPGLLAAAQMLTNVKSWFNKESAIILMGIACGWLSYFMQGKGFWYHVDPLIAFLCLACGIAVIRLLSDRRSIIRLPAAIILAYWIVTWFPGLYRDLRWQKFDLTPQHTLENRILELRARGKNNGIQVMDTTYGAIHALYDLKLVQSTGFIYDFYFYSYPEQQIIVDLRQRFLREMATTKPDLLIVTGQSWPQVGLGYRRMDLWPELKSFLEANYHPEFEQEQFYVIYVHN